MTPAPVAPDGAPVRRVMLLFATPVLTSPWEVYRNIVNGLDTSRVELHAVVNRRGGDLGIRERAGIVVRPWEFGYAHVDDGMRGHARRLLHVAGTARRLADYARREGIELIHTNEDTWSALFGWGAARLAGTRLLIHYHVVPETYGRARRWVMRFLARRADYNIGVSRFVGRRLARLGAPAGRLGYVLNGVDVGEFTPTTDGAGVRRELGIRDDAVLVLQLSRLWRPKRQEDLIRAIAIARPRCAGLRCLIIGWDDRRYDGPYPSYRAELEALCREERVADIVTLWGARSDAPELQAAADIAALPSVDEPFGLVVAEAMASGRPVVATRSGGIPEIVDDGVTGLLVPPRSPGELAERITRLANDPALRARLGAEGRRVAAARFSRARLAADVEDVYLAACAGAPLPPSATLDRGAGDGGGAASAGRRRF